MIPLLYAQSEALPRDLDDETWYRQLVLQGSLLADPLPMEDGSYLLLSSDRRVQRMHPDAGLIWHHDLPRIPSGDWFFLQGRTVMAASGTELRFLDAEAGRLISTAAVPLFDESGSGAVLLASLIRSRLFLVTETGEVRLYQGISAGPEPLLNWQIPGFRAADSRVMLLNDRILMHQRPSTLNLYRVDGKPLAELNLLPGETKLAIHDNLLFLLSDSTSTYRAIDFGGRERFSGELHSRGLFLGAYVYSGSSGDLQLYLESMSLVLYESGRRYLFMELEAGQRFIRALTARGRLVLADSLWRLHEFDLALIADELTGLGLRDQAFSSDPADGELLGDLLAGSTTDRRSFEDILNRMESRIYQGGGAGVLLDYSSALLDLSGEIWGRGGANTGPLSDPQLRNRVLTLLLRTAGEPGFTAALRLLEIEDLLYSFPVVLEALYSASPSTQLSWIGRFNSLLQSPAAGPVFPESFYPGYRQLLMRLAAQSFLDPDSSLTAALISGLSLLGGGY